jgi:hypothetical protein
MKENKTVKQSRNTGIVLVITYFSLFIVNSLVLILANDLFPDWIVLGTASISYLFSIIHSMGMLALLGAFALPLVREYESSSGKMLKKSEWMLVYLVLNFTGVWLISRFADQIGMGVSSWTVVLGLAIVFDLVQGGVMMQLEKYRSKFD